MSPSSSRSTRPITPCGTAGDVSEAPGKPRQGLELSTGGRDAIYDVGEQGEAAVERAVSGAATSVTLLGSWEGAAKRLATSDALSTGQAAVSALGSGSAGSFPPNPYAESFKTEDEEKTDHQQDAPWHTVTNPGPPRDLPGTSRDPRFLPGSPRHLHIKKKSVSR